MDQQLFKTHLEVSAPIINDDITFKYDMILSEDDPDDISFISSLKTITETESDFHHSILRLERIFLKRIQNQLTILTKPLVLEEIDTQINNLLMEKDFILIENFYKEVIQQITETFENQQRLETSLTKKFQEDMFDNLSFFTQPFVNSFPNEQQKRQAQQLSYSAIQSLISILLILIKSAEKNDPTIINQILTLACQLCEQMPMKCLSLSNTNNFLFKSIKPLINYINELSLSNDPILSKQALKILLNFSIVKASLKDILPLLGKLILDTVDIHNVRGLFIQLNNGLDSNSLNITSISLDYLKSIGSYPNSELMKLDEKLFTGQFISSIILSHIDLDNDIYTNKQLKNGSVESSFSLEFHPDTFKQLFDMIEQLSMILTQHANAMVFHTLIVCLKLFTTHLKFLCAIKPNLDRDLLTTNNKIRQLSDSKNNFDLTIFTIDNDLTKWFELLLKLACEEDQKSERIMICKEASKAFVYIIDQRTSSFLEKLSFMHQYIMENQHPILTKEFLIEMNKKEILLRWIEVLCENRYNELDRITAMKILYSFIDIYFNPLNEMNEEQKQQIHDIILSFQQLLLYRLVSRSNNEVDLSTLTCTSSFVSEYIIYIFKKSVEQTMIINELFNSILISLCLMTKTNEIFDFTTIQPIFAASLPLLADYLLQNTINDCQDFISWLIGKMCHVMLAGSPVDSLEMKYTNNLKSIIFAGGCEGQTIETSQYLSRLYKSNLSIYSQFSVGNQVQESSLDKEFLISIYNNTGEGAQLISKMKMFAKNKHHLIQKSIEQQVHDSCAAIFAVYIKYYRRINVAKYELSRTDQSKPHNELMSIFEYANNVQTLFATVKSQGGDCNELYEQIKANTLFLLLSVKESDLIPIIEGHLLQVTPEISQKKGFNYQRQNSRWSKAKYVIRLLRNVMKACIRFKRLMLVKKQVSIQKYDDGSHLKQAIDAFIYGKFSKISTLSINEGKQIELEEINICLCRQYERAMTRLITYRFCQTFIEKIFNLKDPSQVIRILNLYLPRLRSTILEWSYLENIPAVNKQLKEEIGKIYYRIIKMILSHLLASTAFQSKILLQNIFYLLNLSYELNDICHMYDHQFAVTLFTSFISYTQNASFDFRFIGFYWFRLFVVKLCENIQMDILRGSSNQLLRRQREIVFNTLILNELKELKQFKHTLSIDTDGKIDDSLRYIAVDWFVQALTKDISIMSNQLEVNLCINQYLVLLLHCVHYYEHVRSICATVDYISELLFIYHHSQHNTTVLLSLKILRQLIPFLPETVDGKSNVLIEKLLIEMLFSIGESFISQQIIPEIVTELIYIYRTIMCVNSAWQMMAIQFVFDSIKSYLNLKSIETNDQTQINHLLASLSVLNGYIQPFCLGSTVKVSSNEQMNDEHQLAIIIEINKNIIELNTPNATPYFVQYLQTNQKKWVAVDQLQLEIDVSPPNISLLPNANTIIHPILDALGYFIQIDTSMVESTLLLQLKRRSIGVLYHILNTQELIEIFMQKPYASIIAQLAIYDSLSKTHRQPADLHQFSKQHLEQYSLSLDTCERLKQIVETDENENEKMLNDTRTVNNQLIVDTLSMSIWKYSGWKPYATKVEIQSFKKGRIGSNEISIVPMPSTAADMKVLQECGNRHRFKGRISLSSENIHVNLPTFIVDNLQVSEGKWYFCVRVPSAGVQIGWATNGFTPMGNSGVALGDDQYSWSYDGTRDILLNNGVYSDRFGAIRWKENDVCGCGIEIDGEKTNIKYWLNGKLLGTAFKHQSYIALSSTQCNLLPNGSNPIYFPGVSLQFDNYPTAYCEFIFSPEDMQECPLPDGYKPLLLPKLIPIENSIVAYPYSAYLVGDNQQDYFYKRRTTTLTTLLCDFVNEHHLDIDFNLEGNQLILPENSLGFPLSIDNDATSFTIAFDFQILSTTNDKTDDQVDIQLLTLDTMEAFSIHIPLEKIKEKTRTVIVFLLKEQQTQIYINNDCQTFDTRFQTNSKAELDFHLLPKILAGITNISVWKYALSEEHIRRLFTYGLFYVAVDYQQMKEHRKRANTFLFTQKEFPDELLVPFDQPFEESIWEKKKKQVDHDESKYFKTNDQSTIELFGNKTYLILDKSNDIWIEYTLILDISIPTWPNTNEQLTLVILNKTLKLCINHDGHLCLICNETSTESHSKMTLNEYFRLWISIRDQLAKIYINGSLEIEFSSNNDNQFHATSNRFDLFREIDLTKNTTNENILRIQCQSITFLNRSIPIDQYIAQPNSSLKTIVAPPWSIFTSSLIAIGYKKEWILSVIKRYNTTNLQTIDALIREYKQQLLEEDFENKQNHCLKILSRLSPVIDRKKLKDIINPLKTDTDKQIATFSQLILTSWNDLQTSKSEDNLGEHEETSEKNKWFHPSIHGLAISESITEWMREKSIIVSESNTIYKLFDLSQSQQEQTTSFVPNHQKRNYKSIQYSHQNISRKKYLESRIACEHGLTIIYARYIILNMLKIWSNNTTTLFPLERFGDCAFLLSLLRLMDYYYTNTRTYTDDNIDQTSLLINSILKVEIKQLFQCIETQNEMNGEILQNKIPFLFQLQKDIVSQIIHVLLEPSLLEECSEVDAIVDEQTIIKQPNLNFIFKVLNLFVELLKDQSIMKQDQIETLVTLLFPVSMINLIFDLFIVVPTHRSKLFLLQLFSK
jgi:hypothetical protein